MVETTNLDVIYLQHKPVSKSGGRGGGSDFLKNHFVRFFLNIYTYPQKKREKKNETHFLENHHFGGVSSYMANDLLQ